MKPIACAAFLCLGVLSAPCCAAPAFKQSEAALTQTVKRLADAMLDKNATVGSVSALVGPPKEKNSKFEELTPRDPAFSAAEILPGPRRPDSLDLTLARGVVLTPAALQKDFGSWRGVPIRPDGGPYTIAYSYPSARAARLVTVFAELTGEPHLRATRITTLSFRRDDWEEVEQKRR